MSNSVWNGMGSVGYGPTPFQIINSNDLPVTGFQGQYGNPNQLFTIMAPPPDLNHQHDSTPSLYCDGHPEMCKGVEIGWRPEQPVPVHNPVMFPIAQCPEGGTFGLLLVAMLWLVLGRLVVCQVRRRV